MPKVLGWKIIGATFEGPKIIKLPLTKFQKDMVPAIQRGLSVAKKVSSRELDVACPTQSNYFVGGSIGYVDGEMYPAGNDEYGICSGDHMEQKAKSAFISQTLKKEITKPAILTIVVGKGGGYAGPCGNCRDVLREIPGALKYLTIVEAFKDGGEALVFPLSSLLFDDYPTVGFTALQPYEQSLIHKAIKRHPSVSYVAYAKSPVVTKRNYSVTILTEKETLSFGIDSDHTYHSTLPFEAAKLVMRMKRDVNIHKVVIVGPERGDDKSPDLVYKDRQSLDTLNLDHELLEGREFNPDILLATFNKVGAVSKVWRTRLKNLLPLPFTPRNFGEEFMKYLEAETKRFYAQPKAI